MKNPAEDSRFKYDKIHNSSGISHTLVFLEGVWFHHDVMFLIADEYRYFGYHPAGYGGSLIQHKDCPEAWTYSHYNSCD